MESEQPKQYELRSRSRSRSETPQVLSRSVIDNEGSESHYDLRNRSKERSMTPGEVSSSRRSTSKSLPASVIKARNKNMETISEQSGTICIENDSELQSKSSEKSVTVSKSIKKTERRSERQRVKRQLIANGQSEVKDELSDLKPETLEKKRDSLTPKKVMTSDYSSEEGDKEDVPSRPGSAYEFYKQQGEYWNKFPKTDYTYSLASTCRYEVAPGVMAIPNMSRRSLHSDNNFYGSQGSNSQTNSQSSKESYNDGNSTMDVDEFHRELSEVVPQVLSQIKGSGTAGQSVIYKRTKVERHTTRREIIFNNAEGNQNNEKYRQWASPLLKCNSVNNYRYTNNMDSDTELDEAVTSSNHRYQLKNTRRFSKFTSLVTMWFYSILHFFTFGQLKKSQSYTSHCYQRYEDTMWNRLRRQIISIMQWIYLMLVKILLFDSWLLSRASNIRDRIQGRKAKLFWLIFLPLILTAVCWFLPYILSTIPLFFKQFVSHIEEKTSIPIMQNYQHNLKSDEEIRNILDGLVGRIQHLEATKAEHMEQLSNVTQLLQELKQSDSNTWRRYDEKLISLEQELSDQNNNSDKCKLEELNFLKVEFETLKQLYTQLKSCCDTTIPTVVSEEEIQKQANKVFVNYFGSDLSKEDIVRVFQIMNSKIQQSNLEQSTMTNSLYQQSDENGNLALDEIRKIVLGILKIYDADKTGQVDYALESAGGQVISTRCTQHYNIHTRAFKILGLTIYNESNNPRTVIQGNTLQPGMCWAFQDFPGYLLIKLRSLIYVTGFTIEHAPKSNLPNGQMKSAPRKFNVWGLRAENDMEPVLFGEYEFLDSDESLQYFPVQNTSVTSPYEFVEIRIHSNHGQLEYTCLYRFRVHGKLA